MIRFPRFLPLLALGVVLPLSACGGGPKVAADTRYVALDVSSLYNAAQDRLERKQYVEAASLFDETERQHPYTEWARRAQIKSAFSYYAAKDYPKALASARRFLSNHPGNEDAPYAYYLIAMCQYEQISDVRRDQKTTDDARIALTELVQRYPQSPYADDARLKLDLVNDHLAGKEMEVGRFYERRRRWLAATIRFQSVVDDYQTTSHAPEALYRLVESYLALGIPAEAKKSAAVLGSNYPGSEWYTKAYDLIRDNGGVA